MSTVAFGPYHLAPDGRLRRGRVDVHLAPKEAALLAVLVRTAGGLVSKRELLAAVWADEKVLEGSLTRCVSAVRAALGDAGRRGRFIETVHGRGYRFVVRVRDQRERATPAPLLRLAVVPFENGTGDDAHATACAELADEIASSLARLRPPGVGVVAPRGVGNGSRLAAARRADFVVTGCVRRLGARLRLRIELVRASDQLQLAAHAFECDAPRAASALESLAGAAARALRTDLRRTLAGPRRPLRSPRPAPGSGRRRVPGRS